VNRSSESFKLTPTVTSSSSVSVAPQPSFWPWSPPPQLSDQHPAVVSLPCCRLPLLYQEQICSIPPNITLPHNCKANSAWKCKSGAERTYFPHDNRICWNAKYWTIGAMLQLMLRVNAYIVLYWVIAWYAVPKVTWGSYLHLFVCSSTSLVCSALLTHPGQFKLKTFPLFVQFSYQWLSANYAVPSQF